MTKDLTTGNPFKVILKFSLPVIGGNLFQLFYTLADTVIVGRTMGADALAAVGATSIIIYLVLCFIQGITGGFGIRLGQLFGAREYAAVRRSIATSTILSVSFTVLITLISCPLTGQILVWMNTPRKIFQMAYDYMFVVLLGTGATVFYNLISNILRALGDSKTPLYFLVFSSLLNIGLDFVFILPLQMGVAGAAWATVLSQLVSAAFCTLYAIRKFEAMHLSRQDWSVERTMAWDHLKIAFPMGFQMSVMCIGQLAMQAAVNRIGTDAIAGYTAATKVDQMSVLINGAFGVAISSYVAQNYGAGLYDRIRRGVSSCMIQIETCNILMGILILLCQPFIVPLFVNQPSDGVFLYARDYFLMVVPFYLLLGSLQIYRAALQSMGDARTPFLACMIELVLRIICAIGLATFWGYRGICFSSPLAWIGANFLLLPVYFTAIKRLCKMEKKI